MNRVDEGRERPASNGGVGIVTLEIALLGDVTIRNTGPHARHQGSLGSSQARVAFALLTMERRHGVTRDALADAMWPEGLPPTWASALRSVVSRVRGFVAAALGEDDEDLLVARGGSYRLRLPEDTVVDVEVAERQVEEAREAFAEQQLKLAHELADAATRQLGGPFLPEHDGDWVSAQRARLAELRVTGLELMSRAAASLGEGARALNAAQEAVHQAPLRESAHRCLMAAHTATGNRAEALRAYQRLRRMLAEELGVEPDAETEAAYVDLLGPPLLGGSRLDDTAPGSPLTGAPVPFVGRDAELDAASQAWSEALSGSRRVLLVTGEAGVGKTRFAATFARSLTAEGALVLFGRCDQGPAIPYQPVVEMLDALIATTPEHEMPRLSTSAVAELAAVFPSFAASAVTRGTTDRMLLFDAVTKLVSYAARDRPLLIVVDDVQWADGDSALLLTHLLRRVSHARVLVVLVARDDPRLDRPLQEAVQSLDRDGAVHRIRLGGIDVKAYRTLCRQLLPEATDLVVMAPALVAETSGNPFMLIELLRARARGTTAAELASGPVSVGLYDLVASRLAEVGPVIRTLLDVAAVSGSTFDLLVTAAAAGLDEAVALEAVDAAAASGLVVEDAAAADHYRFVHDIVRRAIYGRLTRARRRFLHGRLAETLEQRQSEGHGVDVTILAHHRCAGAEPGGDIRAVRWALAAATEAQGVGALSEAVRWCRSALDHVAPADAALEAEIVTELGLAEAARDDDACGRTLFDAAFRARRCGRTDLAARAALGLADVSRRRPELRDEAQPLVRTVLRDQGPAAGSDRSRMPPVLWARLLASQVDLGAAGAPDEVTEAATAAGILRQHLRDLQGPDRRDDRLHLADDLARLASAIGDTTALAAAQHHRAMVCATTGAGPAADDALHAMSDALGGVEDGLAQALLGERALALAAAQGRSVEAMSVAARPPGPVAVPEVGDPPAGAMAAHQALVARWLQGRQAPVAGDAALPATGPAGLALAEQALAAVADRERGHARVLVGEVLHHVPADDTRLHVLGLLGLAAVELDDPGLTRDLYEQLAPYVTLTCGVGYRSFVGTTSFHLGRLAAAGGEWADAERHLTTALRQLTAVAAHPWIAVTQQALARVLAARGRSSDLAWIGALDRQAQ